MRLPVLTVTLVLTCLILTSALSTNESTNRVQLIRSALLTDYDVFLECTTVLSATIDSVQRGQLPLTRARAAYIRTRMAYKNVEMFLEYLDQEYVNSYLNGAPLPRSDRNSSFIVIIEPEGQQIIEEMLFSDAACTDSALTQLVPKAALLRDNAQQIRPIVRSAPLTDRHCMAMLRQSIVRLVSMGITGFDSPASGNTVRELRVNAQRIAWLAHIYVESLPHEQAELQSQVKGLSKGLVAFFDKQKSFEQMDRVAFIRDWADPLFGALLDVQLARSIESVEDYTSLPQATNSKARHIFDASLLNASYFTGIPAKNCTPELVELGRTLFFDPILSSTNDRACASCHKPEKAFTDGASTSIALGHDGNILRNAPTILNAALADKFFYDLRASRLEDVIDHVVTNDREFGSTVSDMVARIRTSAEYAQKFALAFPNVSDDRNNAPNGVTERIHSWSVGQAIAAYIVSLTRFNSPVDQYLRRETKVLAAPVRRGFNLFMGKAACGTCHFAPTFTGLVPPRYTETESEVLGVPTQPVVAHATLDADIGRFGGTIKDQVVFLRHSFKTMTVRNVALTAPYMHNGVYKTLEQVVDFYNRGGGDGIGIPLKYQTLPFDKLDLTAQEQRDLVSFMKALTDTAGFGTRPSRLPVIDGRAELNKRVIGGVY
ncbi:MAG: cytochrome c peroxidase [bacterium]|nr:cytochrome c peroxidase [bacterium]